MVTETNSARTVYPWQLRAELMAIAELQKSANSGADFAYVKPLDSVAPKYIHVDGEGILSCGCFLGHWLHAYGGLPKNIIWHLEFRSINGLLEMPEVMQYVNVGPIARAYAKLVQIYQDAGYGWLHCIELADHALNRLGSEMPHLITFANTAEMQMIVQTEATEGRRTLSPDIMAKLDPNGLHMLDKNILLDDGDYVRTWWMLKYAGSDDPQLVEFDMPLHLFNQLRKQDSDGNIINQTVTIV